MKNFSNNFSGNDLSNCDHPARQLKRAAQAAGHKDERDLFRDDPLSEERLGIAIGLIRRRKNITIENLAQKAGCELEILIALEAGILEPQTIHNILPRIVDELGIDPDILIQIVNNE